MQFTHVKHSAVFTSTINCKCGNRNYSKRSRFLRSFDFIVAGGSCSLSSSCHTSDIYNSDLVGLKKKTPFPIVPKIKECLLLIVQGRLAPRPRHAQRRRPGAPVRRLHSLRRHVHHGRGGLLLHADGRGVPGWLVGLGKLAPVSLVSNFSTTT